jgi:hypothetical protein
MLCCEYRLLIHRHAPLHAPYLPTHPWLIFWIALHVTVSHTITHGSLPTCGQEHVNISTDANDWFCQ